MEALGVMARNCAKYGISITYVIWTTTALHQKSYWYSTTWRHFGPSMALGSSNWNLPGLKEAVGSYALGVMTLDSWRILPFGEPWLVEEGDEPGNVLFNQPFQRWDTRLALFIDGYLKAIGEFFSSGSGSRVFASYDIFNEPDIDDEPTGLYFRHRVDFIKETYLMLKRYHVAAALPCTIGWSFMSSRAKQATTDLRNAGVQQTYLSSHTYEFDVNKFRQEIRDARDFAMAGGLPYVCSEFWERGADSDANYPRAMAPYLDVVANEFMGSQIWGFMAYNVFRWVRNRGVAIDGFLTPTLQQFGPKGTDYSEYVSSALGPLYWPQSVRIDETPPRGMGDQEAVKRWTRSRSGPVNTW